MEILNRISRGLRTIKNASIIDLIKEIVGVGGATTWAASLLLPLTRMPTSYVSTTVLIISLFSIVMASCFFVKKAERNQTIQLELTKLKAINQAHTINHATPTPTTSLPHVGHDTSRFTTLLSGLDAALKQYLIESNQLTASTRPRVDIVKKLLILITSLPTVSDTVMPVQSKLLFLQTELESAMKEIEKSNKEQYFSSVRSSSLLTHLRDARNAAPYSLSNSSQQDPTFIHGKALYAAMH
ncbi:MAG: hypothetical protein ACHQAX_02375 [Gammaproteobacteria bacterium]